MKEIKIQIDRDSIKSLGGKELQVNMTNDKISSTTMKGYEIKVNVSERGTDGRTPIKGVDYFTEEDKREIIREVEFEAVGIEPMTEEELYSLF